MNDFYRPKQTAHTRRPSGAVVHDKTPNRPTKKIAFKISLKPLFKAMAWFRSNESQARVFAGVVALVMICTIAIEMQAPVAQAQRYSIAEYEGVLIKKPIALYGQKLELDTKNNVYEYNKDYTVAQEVAGTVAGPKFGAAFYADKDKRVVVSDAINNVNVSFKPKFSLDAPEKNQNRVVYPLKNLDAKNVYTLKAGSIKEDIIIDSFQKNDINLSYEVDSSDGTELRLEKDGSVAVYGANTALLGNVTTGNDKDKALLDAARKNAQKTELLFRIPAPFIVQANGKKSEAKAWFELNGKTLTIHTAHLDKATFPLSVDPSVYIESASKLMRGNNESNIDFDVDNELIQKSQTSGARIDGWTATNNLSSAVWGQGTAVAGGYIYSAGGAGGNNTTTVTYYSAGTSTFTVPIGVTQITVKTWGGGGGGGSGSNSTGVGGTGGGGGYAKAVINVTPSEDLTILVGAGGAKAAANNRGGSGGEATKVSRSSTILLEAGAGGGGGGRRGGTTGTNGDAGAGGGTTGQQGRNGSTGPPGTGGTQAAGGIGGNGTGDGRAGVSQGGGDGGAPSTSCATNATGTGSNGTGGAGGTFTTSCAAGGGGGGGYYGGGGGASTSTNSRSGGGGGGGSSYINPTGLVGGTDVSTVGSYQTPGNDADSDRNGAGQGGSGGTNNGAASAGTAGGVIITYTLTGSTAVQTVSWAKFNTTTNAIESPNPGAGACTGWCTNSAYDLPVALKDLSLVAYNGFLYAIGGATGAGTPQTSVYIAKIGANGEPQLWHPTGGTPGYWYTDTALGAARSKFAAVAYNNRLYILGGLTTPCSPNCAVLSTNTVQYANINPTGTLSTWSATGMSALSTARYGLSAQVYNDTLYAIGGNATLGGSPVATVEYSKLSSTGTMNGWIATSSLATSGRLTMGGIFSTIWAGYMYVGGGCTAVNANGYCTAIASDVQLASINADGSLAEWNTILGLTNSRIGYTLIAWQGGLYRLGGCRTQNTSTGVCDDTAFDVDYGVINPTGEASTVASSVSSGTAPCSGGSPYRCDLPSTANIGNMLNSAVILNGYLYIIGGCTTNGCTSALSGNTAYTAISSTGELTLPASCPGGTAVDSYCVDSTNPISGGIGAAATTSFNGQIYLYGGINGTALKNNVYHVPVNSDGSLNGTWTAQTLTGGGSLGTTSVSWAFVYARAKPSTASSVPGNFYAFGGCSTGGGIGCSAYTENVYKCDIAAVSGDLSNCTTGGQLAIGTATDGNGTSASGTGLGAMAGTVYANYIYLIGGLAPNLADLRTTRYAKFDDNNNVVTAGTGWVETSLANGNLTNTGRRRGSGFGYNGYLYVAGGYDATNGVLADIEFAKLDVSDGSIGAWRVSTVSINQRWGLALVVSNSYAFVIGGCIDGNSPTCNAGGPTRSVQTFQIYNNDSGAIKSFTAGNTLGVDRVGGASTVLNGYIYYAGGCTAMDCSALSANTYYASIDANGTVGSWSAGGALPGARAWGKLVAAGNSPNETLYYIGGQTGAATTTAVGSIYFTSGISGGNPTWNGSVATRGIGNTAGTDQARTQFGAAVWDNMLFVTGGFNASGTAQNTVYASPLLDSGGNISSIWTSTTTFDVPRGGHTTIAYANNLYVLGGFDGTSYLNDVQFTQINLNSSTKRPDGTVDAWTFTTSLSSAIRDADGFAANGYMYLVGGRTAATTCAPNTLIAPVSANTTIATGNNPTGVGEWFETNVRYTGDRYGAAAVYYGGRLNLIGGGCSAFVGTGDRMYYATVKSQPQLAKYSRMIDTDTDVFPTKWLLNGLDNSTGARWYMRYRSSTAATASWGQETNYGAVSLGTPAAYIPKDSGGTNTNYARYYFMSVNIDSSQAFGYPEDVNRGPTITDLSLFFTADPSKRLIHGKTFIGGEQQPLDTPF